MRIVSAVVTLADAFTLCRLTSLTAVNHLANLQYLDISRNSLESVNRESLRLDRHLSALKSTCAIELSCLEHLRELRLDHNSVSDIKDLLSIDSLVKVSCIGNKLTELDFTHAKWCGDFERPLCD